MSEGCDAEHRLITFGEFVIDPGGHRLLRGGSPVPTEPKVLDLLLLLIRQRHRVVPKEEILRLVWPGVQVVDSALSRCVSIARTTIGDDGVRQAAIRTVYGRGYQFVAPVITMAPAAPERKLVGRASELEVIGRSIDDSASGNGGLLFITGEPGIGKTRLAEEVQRLAAYRRIRSLVGRCGEGDGAPPYWPWRQMLGSVSGTLFEDLDRTNRKQATRYATDVAGSVERRRLFAQVAAAIRRVTDDGALVLIFDDLHQADLGSLHLLRFVIAELTTRPLLVVVTHRPMVSERDAARRELVAMLSREAHARVLRLGGLDVAEVALMAHSVLGVRLSSELAGRVHHLTAGNPFFVTRLLPFVGQPGAEPMDLPVEVRDAIARQVVDLPDATQSLLRVAAVSGREFESNVLASVVRRSRAWVTDALKPALLLHLVERDAASTEAHRFVHVVVRDTLYGQLRTRERARWHARFLRTLVRDDDLANDRIVSQLSAHAYRSILVDGPTEAIRWATRAGELASSHLAYEEAARQFGRAVEVLEDASDASPAQRCEVLIALGEAHTRAGDRGPGAIAFVRAAGIARALDDADRLALAALGLAPGCLQIEAGTVDPLLVGALENALAELPPGAVDLGVRTRARLAMALYWGDDRGRRQELAEEALALAERSGNVGLLCHAEVASVSALWGPDNLADRIRVLPKAVEIAEGTGRKDEVVLYRLLWITTLIESGDFDGVRRQIGRFSRDAVAVAEPQALWTSELLKAMVALHEGRLGETVNQAEVFLALGRRAGDRNAWLSYLAVVGFAQMLSGQGAAIAEEGRRAAEDYPNVPAPLFVSPLFFASAGQMDVARDTFAQVRGAPCAELTRNVHWFGNIASAAETCTFLGDVEAAEQLLGLLEPFAARLVPVGFGTACIGSVSYYLARLAATLGRRCDAARWFEDALVALRRSGGRTWEALTLLRFGALLAAGDEEKAQRRGRAMLADGQLLASKLGITMSGLPTGNAAPRLGGIS